MRQRIRASCADYGDVEDLAARREGADVLRSGRVLAEHHAAARAHAAIVRTVEHVVVRRLDHERDGLGRKSYIQT
jgi:hypothetical protein